MSPDNPEVGRSVQTGAIVTNYHDVGNGPPLLLLHGSGPGVSAWANWRLPIQHLSPRWRTLAPDFAGFGYTTGPEGTEYSRDLWLGQVVAFLDALGIARSLCCRTAEHETWLPSMYGGTGIDSRHMSLGADVVADVLQGTRHSGSVFLPTGADDDSGPTTGQRMDLYLGDDDYALAAAQAMTVQGDAWVLMSK